MFASRHHVAAAAALAIGGLSGCADSTGIGGARPVSLSFSTGAPSPTSASNARFAVIGSADALVITKAQVVFSRTELERTGAVCDDAREPGDDDCAELKTGPMLVNLPLDGTTKAELTVSIPAGDYDRFEAKVDAITSETDGPNAEAAAFLAANPGFRGVSVRVEGTYNGTPFVYTTGVESGIELSLVPALTVDGADNNVTVLVDVASWFRNGTTTIDPSTANAGGANKAVVDERIKRSFKVFEDDDHNGRDD
jgi:hypothetical protein